MRFPLRVRMTAWYVALLAIIIVAVGAFVVVRLRADLIDATDSTVRPASGQVALDYRQEGTAVEFTDSARGVLKGERATAQLLTAEGTVVATFGDSVAFRPMIRRRDIARASSGQVFTITRSLGPGGEDFRLAVRPVQRDGRTLVVVAGQSLGPVDRSVRALVVLLLLAVPAALVATAAGGWWLARRSLRPVERMASTAEAIGVNRMDDRVPEPRTRDELGHLARTLNMMLDRIRHAVVEQRRLVADASHELRTPLAAMRSEIDVSLRADELSPAARDVLLSAREEVDRMTRTVDDLLTLATVDDGVLELRPERIDMAAIARGIIEGLEPLARGRGVAVEQQGEPATVLADPGRLGQAIRNVLENAIKFSPMGGTVVVTTGAVEPGLARIVIEDAGPGVPAELRERIFDRFFRVDPSRTRASGGSGLGLAIVREIVHAHGGTVRVEGREPGSAFVVEMPEAAVDWAAEVSLSGAPG